MAETVGTCLRNECSTSILELALSKVRTRGVADFYIHEKALSITQLNGGVFIVEKEKGV